jgi:hypothetical protein
VVPTSAASVCFTEPTSYYYIGRALGNTERRDPSRRIRDCFNATNLDRQVFSFHGYLLAGEPGDFLGQSSRLPSAVHATLATFRAAFTALFA